ncbi:hypothetical protein DL95DRAFT_418936 [Leptodontidium sp. 2 PMI_412]|nr:hypothetical protein DL95DRAFT_418936 [Leptodontidium sp. 2 PMI_412]
MLSTKLCGCGIVQYFKQNLADFQARGGGQSMSKLRPRGVKFLYFACLTRLKLRLSPSHRPSAPDERRVRVYACSMPSPQTSRQEGGSVLDNRDETFEAYNSNQPFSNNRETLQAWIELQREKIRALELAAEERRRTEQLRDRLRNEERQRRVEQNQTRGHRRIERRWIDGPIRE